MLKAQEQTGTPVQQGADVVYASDVPQQFNEIALGDLLTAIARGKRAIFLTTLVTSLFAAGAAFLMPVEFTAESVIFTPRQSESSLSGMSQLAGAGGGLSALAFLSGFGLHNSTDLYVGILQSRTIADALISRFELKRIYRASDMYAARKKLARNTTIKTGRDTLIHIRVGDRSATRAAQLANAYVEELFHQNARIALSDATERRLFYEGRLAKEKDALANAEVAMRQTQESTGLVAPAGQAEALVRALSQLRGEILSHQALLDGMRAYATEDNPRLQMLKRELSSLRAELTRLEQMKHPSGSPEVAAGELPEAGLEYVRRYRDVKYHETLFEILSKEYEAARLDEARSGAPIQIVDMAIPPDRKSWPPRAIIVGLSCLLAVLASSLWCVLRHTSELSSADLWR